jgi:hypothetical protein
LDMNAVAKLQLQNRGKLQEYSYLNEKQEKCFDPTRVCVKKRLEYMLKFIWDWRLQIFLSSCSL